MSRDNLNRLKPIAADQNYEANKDPIREKKGEPSKVVFRVLEKVKIKSAHHSREISAPNLAVGPTSPNNETLKRTKQGESQGGT